MTVPDGILSVSHLTCLGSQVIVCSFMVRTLLQQVLGRSGKQAAKAANAPLELPPSGSRERARSMVMGLQDEICSGLEALDGQGRFAEAG